MTTLSAPSFSQGYALVRPDGGIVAHSFRATAEEAIATRLPRSAGRAERWQRLAAKGWSVRLTYARVWEPLFFTSRQTEIEEETE